MQKVLLADQPTKQFVGVDEVSPSPASLLSFAACCLLAVKSSTASRPRELCRQLQPRQGDRMCPAVQVGALVRHLCGDDARSFTGACISIDGGWTAR